MFIDESLISLIIVCDQLVSIWKWRILKQNVSNLYLDILAWTCNILNRIYKSLIFQYHNYLHSKMLHKYNIDIRVCGINLGIHNVLAPCWDVSLIHDTDDVYDLIIEVCDVLIQVYYHVQ